MDEREYPRDDNLRLILSQNHEEWLCEKITVTKRRIVGALVVAALGLLWLAGTFAFGTIRDDAGALVTELLVFRLLAMAAIPIGGVVAVRGYFVLKAYGASLMDHQDFLRRYNRLCKDCRR